MSFSKESTVQLRTGNRMPVMGLGTWLLTDNTPGTIEYALRLGFQMIDTSSDYGTQPGIGEGIKRARIGRSRIYIVSKVEETDDAYSRSRSNLRELGLDHVDLMLIHRPPFFGAGEHLWEGLIQARDEGLATDIGVSNYTTDLIDRLIKVSGEVPAVNQIEWSPFGYSEDMRRYCDDIGIVIMAYSPLTRRQLLGDETLMELGAKYDKTSAQMLIRWNLQRGTVPIPKANQRRHLQENINVFDFRISENDMQVMDALNMEFSSLGSLPYV